MIVSSVAFVLCIGKFTSAIYNWLQSIKSPNSDPKNTFEKRNICAKTYRAALLEALVYLIITIIALILGR